jgi:uncharacterized OB-fold protein
MSATATPLVGTHCPTCDRVYFPARDLCPTCYAALLPERFVGPTGVVAAWTVVRVGNRYPVPYALCYADFPGDVRVLGRIADWDQGMPLREGMAITTQAVNEVIDGRLITTAHTFATTPADMEA